MPATLDSVRPEVEQPQAPIGTRKGKRVLIVGVRLRAFAFSCISYYIYDHCLKSLLDCT